MHADAMHSTPADLQRSLACLSHTSRFQILLRLLTRPWFVSELAQDVKLSQSCTTRHLQAMSRVGLVRSVRAGRRVFFEAERGAPVLAAFEACLGAEHTGPLSAGLTTDRSPAPPPRSRPAAAPKPRSRSAIAPRDGGAEAAEGAPEAPAAAGTRRGNGDDMEDFLL